MLGFRKWTFRGSINSFCVTFFSTVQTNSEWEFCEPVIRSGASRGSGENTWERLIWQVTSAAQPRQAGRQFAWQALDNIWARNKSLSVSLWCGRWSQSPASSGQHEATQPPSADCPETIINSRNTWKILRPLNRPIKIFETNLWHWACFVSAERCVTSVRSAGERTAVSGVWLGLSVDLWQEIAGSALFTRSENHWVKQLGAPPPPRLEAAGTRQLRTDSWQLDTASGLAHSSQSRSNYQVKTTYNVTLTAVQASPNATDTIHELVVKHDSWPQGDSVIQAASVRDTCYRALSGLGTLYTGWWGGGEQVMDSNAGLSGTLTLTTTGWHTVSGPGCQTPWSGAVSSSRPAPASPPTAQA